MFLKRRLATIGLSFSSHPAANAAIPCTVLFYIYPVVRVFWFHHAGLGLHDAGRGLRDITLFVILRFLEHSAERGTGSLSVSSHFPARHTPEKTGFGSSRRQYTTRGSIVAWRCPMP